MDENKEYWDQAMFELYPRVQIIYGDIPKDKDKNPVVYDADAVNQRASELEAIDIQRDEAIESVRASALQKLVENAGLTVKEVKSFINIEVS